MGKRKTKTTEPKLDEVALMAIEALDAPAVESHTDESIEDVVQILEATEEVLNDQATVVQVGPAEEHNEPAVRDPKAFDDAIMAIDQDEAIRMTHLAVNAIDARAEFEANKDAGNANIQRTLNKARKALSMPSAVKAMMVSGFDLGQVNRSVNVGHRYNVYALGKLADVLNGVVNGAIGNAINNACLRSLFKFETAGVAFTMDMAKAACSDKIRVEDRDAKACLVRHTVSASTAPTQASSTMQALVDLGVVHRSGSERNPIFALTDAPIVAKLASVLQ